tara:strand:- start:396 stop:602 length:207 start_codon:yes stop_codon:yes gene_type:complete
VTNPDTIRLAIDALGGCERAAVLLHVNDRTVRRWYSGARPPGPTSLNVLQTALIARAMSIRNLAEEIT